MKNKGITLIALIVTIVVLIILAGITLNIALGENGIFTKAKLSADTYTNAAANEAEELRNTDEILDELINGPKPDPYSGLATQDEVVPQLFMYEILTPATASNEEGVDGVTKLADTSDTIKIAATETTGTAKITGINYDYAFGDISEYVSDENVAGSGYDSVDDETSKAKFTNRVRGRYSKLVIPATIKLNSSGEYDANGTEYSIIEVGDLGDYFYSNGTLRFAFGENVTEIILPNTIKRLSDGAAGEKGFISHFENLNNIKLPNSITTIGDNAFYGCSSLTSITIPNSVTSIGRQAFYLCSSLTNVTIPNSVTSIGELAFVDCSNLTSITIPSSVTSIGDNVFYNLASGSTIYVQSQDVANLLSGKYTTSKTTVVVDPSKF